MANATADASDVVLPGACWAEKSGTMINVAGRLQRLNGPIDGPGLTLEPGRSSAISSRRSAGATASTQSMKFSNNSPPR
jgi:NADH dehydrogenase/NADH:ubiquinone oxidoreductase subunit G